MSTMESAVIETHPVESCSGEGVVTGVLIGFKDEGRIPLVLFAGQPGAAAIGAGTVVDLHGSHIGRQVALMFERCDLRRPIIMGLLRGRRRGRFRSSPPPSRSTLTVNAWW